jgi:hypothetical protein
MTYLGNEIIIGILNLSSGRSEKKLYLEQIQVTVICKLHLRKKGFDCFL